MSDIVLLRRASEMSGLLGGTVTQIRMPMKPQPPETHYSWHGVIDGWAAFTDHPQGEKGHIINVHCPFGQSGDRLIVKEPWVPCGDGGAVWFRAGVPIYRGGRPTGDWGPYDPQTGLPVPSDVKWRSAATMPRWASRLTLVVGEIKVQRVQDATRDDVIAEGIPHCEDRMWYDVEYWWDARYPRFPWASNAWTWLATVRKETT